MTISLKEVLEDYGAGPLTILIELPDGCDAGRFESAEAFAEAFIWLKKKYPEKKFQLLPFSYRTVAEKYPCLESILAVEG